MFFPRRCRAAELRDGLVVCSWPDRLRRRLRLWLRLLRHLPLTHRPYPGRAHFGREHCNLAACAAQLVLDCNELGLRSGPVVQRASLHAVLDASLLPHRDSPRRGRCCRRRRRPRRAPSPQATPCGGRLGVLGRREHDAATRLGVRAPRSAAGCLLARTCQPAAARLHGSEFSAIKFSLASRRHLSRLMTCNWMGLDGRKVCCHCDAVPSFRFVRLSFRASLASSRRSYFVCAPRRHCGTHSAVLRTSSAMRRRLLPCGVGTLRVYRSWRRDGRRGL
jgi:hypothetical protein